MANSTAPATGVVIVGDRPKPLQDLYHLWLADGQIQMDVRKFHEVTPTEPTATFPYPR